MKKSKEIVIPKLPYGEGSISMRKDGTLTYRKRIGEGRNKVPVFVYGKTVKEVMDKMKKKEKELQAKTVEDVKETLTEALHSWLESYKRPALKFKSYDRIECTLNNQIDGYDIAHMRWQSIDNEAIQEHLNDLVAEEYAWSTIKKAYDLLNEFYEYQFARNKIENNPMKLVVMPLKENVLKPEKDIEYLDEEDIARFIHEASKMMQHRNLPKYSLGHAFIFMIFTGVRAGEAIALKWKDVSFENKIVHINKSISRVINREYDENNPKLMKKKGIKKYIDVTTSTKNKATRLLALNKHALEALKTIHQYSKYTDAEDYVLATRTGSVNNLKNMTDRLHVILERAETKVQKAGLHVLRHTNASLLFEKKIPIEIIASLLGHSVDVCRKVYIHFAQKQKAEAINKLDGFNFDIEL